MLYRWACLGTERVELDKVGYLPLLPERIQVLYGLCSTLHSRKQNTHTGIAKTPKGAEIQGLVLKDGGFRLSVFRMRSARWLVQYRHKLGASNKGCRPPSLNSLALAALARHCFMLSSVQSETATHVRTSSVRIRIRPTILEVVPSA